MSGVIIDTCMWSLALRRKDAVNEVVAKEIQNLIHESRAKIIGLIRQEVLSGYSDRERYIVLRDQLRYFPSEETLDADYELAAEFSNLCRRKGIQGSHGDFLICAVSSRLNMKIYTYDKDFQHYSKYLNISLYSES